MYKKMIILIALAITFVCTSCNNNISEKSSKINVSVSFNAMKEFVEAIGGDKVVINTLIPDGTEPHEFEPKANDLASLKNANIFVYNGFGFESWANMAIEASNNKNLISVEASKGIEPILISTENEPQQFDPHTWLSVKNAVIQCYNIKEALVLADSSNKEYYENNYNEYAKKLNDIYNEYSLKIEEEPKKSFVTGHAAFGYLCRDFNITQSSVEDVYAEGEPSAKQLATLIEYCKENNITTIFSEEMASPEISKTLADEVGAKVETIYTIESSNDKLTYLERINYNLDKIYESLED